MLHRRAGKTTCILNHHLRAGLDDGWEAQRLKTLRPSLKDSELQELIAPPGGRHYGHVMPTRVQAKVVAWDKLKYYAATVPETTANEAELLLKLPNGNKIQLFGADDPDSLRGPAFSGLSFDEYSQQPSNIFSEVLSKALGDHLGYAVFAGTIKGKDHLYRTWLQYSQDPEYFSLWQDVDKSIASEQGITIQVLEQAMNDDRKQVAQGLMSQEEFDQEWFLSLEAAIKGAFYMKELAACRRGGRITHVPYDPDYPVNTAWDLGYTDDTAIWFYQNIANEIRILDFHVESGGTIELTEGEDALPGSLTKAVLSRPYRYGRHWLPHDAKAKTMAANGKSVVERLSRFLGFSSLAIVPELSFQDGVQSVRAILGRCWFDEEKCDKGIEALLHYKRKYDNKLEVYAKNALHDWSSHPADAFRMLAVAERRAIPAEPIMAREVKAAAAVQRLIDSERNVTLDQLWERSEQRMRERVRI